MCTQDLKIMQDHGNWIFEDDQIIKLKQGDKTALNDFFTNNYNYIHSLAMRFYKRYSCYLNRDIDLFDLINQVYVDLIFYDFSSNQNLFLCIFKGSFLNCGFGGFSCRGKNSHKRNISFDCYSDDGSNNSSWFFDYFTRVPDVASLFDIETYEEREKKDKKVIDFLKKHYKNKKDLNIMFCKIFTDLKLNEIRGDEFEEYCSFEEKVKYP